MANPIQQGLKPNHCPENLIGFRAAMANPIQQGLKPRPLQRSGAVIFAAMANPIQQGLKPYPDLEPEAHLSPPQWLIQYNKD